MTTRTLALVLATSLAAFACSAPETAESNGIGMPIPPPAPAESGQVQTPELVGLTEIAVEDGWGLIAATPLGRTGSNVGFAFTCEGDTKRPTASVYLGSYPPAGRAVQLAIRLEDGRIERFGPTIEGHAGPASGFHSPVLTERSDVLRFAEAALRSGSLISNGYNSFWVRLQPATARMALTRVRECLP